MLDHAVLVRLFVSLLLLGITIGPLKGQLYEMGEPTLSAGQINSDIHYLRIKLEKWHPNLYLNAEKSSLDNLFNLLENQTNSLKTYEFYAHASLLSGLIADGHLTFLPGAKELNKTNLKVLPFHVVYLNDNLIVDQQYSAHPVIPRGSRIIWINKTAGGAIANNLMGSLPRDGNNWQYQSWILNQFFAPYYSFSYGHPDTYEIATTHEGQSRLDTLKAISRDSVQYYRQQIPSTPLKGIEFSMEEDQGYAILKIRDFHQQVLRKTYHQDFKKEIKAAFMQINDHKIQHLILDLRDNQGGNLQYGNELLSRLVNKPFTMVEAYYKRDGNKSGSLKKVKGPCSKLQQPEDSAFKGQVYVCINGGSFSNSSIVASCLKRNTNAIFIGEETGGNRQIIGGFARKIKLPQSGIQVEIPMRRIVLDSSLPFAKEGMKPDYEVKPTYEDILNQNDSVMNKALQLINEKE